MYVPTNIGPTSPGLRTQTAITYGYDTSVIAQYYVTIS